MKQWKPWIETGMRWKQGLKVSAKQELTLLNKTRGDIMKAWKCLKKGMKSEHGDNVWKLGEWKKFKGELELCNDGFHVSKFIQDSILYVQPGFICEVEYKGEVIEGDDKFVAGEMRIVKKYAWHKKDSVTFALFCLKRSMKYFDRKKFPDVWKVCVRVVKILEAYILKPSKKLESAAWSAAWSAESAAWAAAWSAWSAARSARSAAWSAAW